VIECDVCGATLSAASDDELVQATTRHMGEHHPDQADGERIQALVAEQAYDASDS
jgi:hypothetical protein